MKAILDWACLAVLSLAFFGCASTGQHDPRWPIDCSYRIAVEVEPGAGLRKNLPAGIELDFERIFRENGIPGRLDPDSIRVTCVDPATGLTRRADIYGEPFALPHALTGDFRIRGAGHIWWRMPDSTLTRYHIYFDSLDNGRKAPPRALGPIGVGDVLHYNNGRTGFAGSVGLHSEYWLLDWDGDGLKDLVGFGYRYYEPDYPLPERMGNRFYFWKNIGTPERPLFAPRYPLRADDGEFLTYAGTHAFHAAPVDWNEDGLTDFVGIDGRSLILLENTGRRDVNGCYILKQPRAVMELKEVSEFRKNFTEVAPRPRPFVPRGLFFVDWDGDGRNDMVLGFRKVNELSRIVDPSRGVIPFGMHLMIFELYRNVGQGPDGNPIFATPEVIREERGLPIFAFSVVPGGPAVIDYDNDGDLDLLFHDLTNRPLEGARLMFCENVGTRSEPLFIGPIPVLTIDGYPQFVDWNNDGRFDLLAGGELFENINPKSGFTTGIPPNTTPLSTYVPNMERFPKFVSRGLIQQINPPIMSYFTVAADWNGDGALDLIGGFRSFVMWFRNSGTTEAPVFEEPVLLHAGGKPIHLPNWLDPQSDEPSHWGPQTPSEPIYGWVNPSVADWDGDGDLDLFVTGQRWEVKYFENVGTRTAPKLASGRQVRCNGDPHEFSWRSKIGIGDLDGDGQAEFVVTSHHDNVFHMYKPSAVQNDPNVLEVVRGPALMLENGEPVRGWFGQQNNNGDNHSQLVDWNGDGLLDLINGSLWAVRYYENVGTPTSPVFRAHGRFDGKDGRVAHTFMHAGSFDAADWTGDGRPDLILGTECPSDWPRGNILHLFARDYLENRLPAVRAEEVEKR